MSDNKRALPVAEQLCTWPSCGHTAKGQCNPISALPVSEPEPQAVRVKPLSDEDRDWIDARADELFRANERRRGGIRNQTITPQDFRDYFVVTATRERVLSQIEAVSVAQVRAEALDALLADDEMCLRLAEGYDREDAAQRGEPTPHTMGEDGYAEWAADRIACAKEGLRAIRALIEREPT